MSFSSQCRRSDNHTLLSFYTERTRSIHLLQTKVRDLSSLHLHQTPNPILPSPRLSPYCVNKATKLAIDKKTIVYPHNRQPSNIYEWMALTSSIPSFLSSNIRLDVLKSTWRAITTTATIMARTRSAAHMRLPKRKRTM